MTRGQWLAMVLMGGIALVAFHRTEIIAQRIGMATVIRKPTPAGGIA